MNHGLLSKPFRGHRSDVAPQRLLLSGYYKKIEEYVTVKKGSNKKSIFKIIASKSQIVVVPSFAKIHYGEKQSPNFHTTRHKEFLHNTKYEDGKPSSGSLKSYYEYRCENINDLTNYELISCYRVSPSIFESDFNKNYTKNSQNEFCITNEMLTDYIVYVFIENLQNNSSA